MSEPDEYARARRKIETIRAPAYSEGGDLKLVHYSAEPLGELRVIPQTLGDANDLFKPRGLWVSDDACEDNWRTWCEDEGFRLGDLVCVTDIMLKPDASVLVISTAEEIDAFTRRWAVHPFPGNELNMFIDWPCVRTLYAGLIITPYIWSRRLSIRPGDLDAMWYYSWDCASGCIWDPAAIESVRLREREK